MRMLGCFIIKKEVDLVKAVIMAGGQGTRLKAVSGDTPKPMVSLLGRPMLEHIILLLKSEGFEDICITLRYRAHEIKNHFGDGGSLGVRLSYRTEDSPLGTAGGVKNCRDFYADEAFLVISGDAACDFRLGKLMEKHLGEKAAVTMALHQNPCPLSYGLTVTDKNGLVRSFIEKPDWTRVVSDMVNTGIYIISPRVMELVPEGQEFDFAKDLFPLLLSRGEKIIGMSMDGYWCDVGSPLSYYRCCVDALEGRLRLNMGEEFSRAADVQSEPEPDEGGLICACHSRAALMGALSQAFLELDADYSDGIRVTGRNYRMHIAPLASRSAVRIAVNSPDAEFARRLAFSARELAEAFGL